VQIKQAEIDGFWWQPEFEFHAINVGRVQLNQLEVSINLWRSIMQRQWVTDEIIIDHLQLRVDQDAQKNMHISGVSSSAISIEKNNDLLISIIAWIKSQPRIIFSNARIDLHQANGGHFFIQDANVMIKNNNHTHIVSGNLSFKKTMPTTLHFVVNNIGNKTQFFLQGKKVRLSEWSSLLSEIPSIKKTVMIHGDIDFKLWATMMGQRLQRVQMQFISQNVSDGHFKINALSANMLWTYQNAGW
jgi:hypothetical protein